MVDIPIDRIEVGQRLLELDEKKIERLTTSIRETGLLCPIAVQARQVTIDGMAYDGHFLVAGLHRLTVFKRLGKTHIPAHVLDIKGSGWELIIAECDENLSGSTLDRQQRSFLGKKRKEAYEALHPETRNKVAQAEGMRKTAMKNKDVGPDDQVDREVSDPKTPSYAAATAAATGKSEVTVRREIRRAEKITAEARKAMEGTKLANKGVFLDALTHLDPEDQLKKIQEELAKPKAKRGRPKGKANKPTAPKPEKIVIAQFMKIKHPYMKACKEAQDMFVEWLNSERKSVPKLYVVNSR